MRKVLITGLGIGKDFGVCDVTNMDYSELLINPEVLLWANKICIPNSDYYMDTVVDKECKLVFSILEESNLIYKYNKDSINSDRFDNVLNQATIDMISIAKHDPSLVIKQDAYAIETASSECKYQYCVPNIASIYSSIILADEIGASCLFNDHDKFFLNYRFQKLGYSNDPDLINSVYKEIFNCQLPNDPILHKYGTYRGCSECAKENHCKDTYLLDVEKKLLTYLQLRDCDEMVQLRAVIDDIISKRDRLLGEIEAEDIIHDLRYRQNYIKKNINLRFKRAKRFFNLVTTVSVPLTLFGLINNNPAISVTAGITTGASTIADKAFQNYESKNNWVNFIGQNQY